MLKQKWVLPALAGLIVVMVVVMRTVVVMGVLVGVRMVVVVRKTGMIVIEMHRNQSPFNVFYIHVC